MISPKPAINYRVGSRMARECRVFYWGPHPIHMHRPEHPKTQLPTGWQYSCEGVVVANDIRLVTVGQSLERFEKLARQLGPQFPDTLRRVMQKNKGKLG